MTDTPETAELLAVTQQDRDAAAEVAWKSPTFLRELREGKHDDADVVQAFARHRLANTRPTAKPLEFREWTPCYFEDEDEVAADRPAGAYSKTSLSPKPLEGQAGELVERRVKHLIGLLRREARHSGVWFSDKLDEAATELTRLTTALAAREAKNEALREKLEIADALADETELENEALRAGLAEARLYHETNAKALSKQPPNSDRNWRLAEHREERDKLDALLSRSGGTHD